MRILIAAPLARTVRAWAEVLRLEPAFEVETVVGGSAAIQASLALEPPDLAMLDLTPPPARVASLPPQGVERRRGALVASLHGHATRGVLGEPEPAPALDEVERWASSRPGIDFLVVSDRTDPEGLLRAMQAGVREVLPAPASPEAVLVALRRQWRRRQPAVQAGARRGAAVLALVGCKGGSGATFVATQVAHALARGGRQRVLLIDLDLPFGDAALCLAEHTPARGLADVVRDFDRLDAELLRASLTEVAPGLRVLAAPPDPSLPLEVDPAQVRRIVQLARATHDHVVIDVGRAFGPVALQVLDLADQVGAVLQLTLPHVRDAQRLKRLLASLDLAPDKLRWIVNRHQRDGALKLEDVKRLLGGGAVSVLPNQYEWAAAAVNQGRPVVELAPRSAIARALAQLAADMAADMAADRAADKATDRAAGLATNGAADPSAQAHPLPAPTAQRRLRWWRWGRSVPAAAVRA